MGEKGKFEVKTKNFGVHKQETPLADRMYYWILVG